MGSIFILIAFIGNYHRYSVMRIKFNKKVRIYIFNEAHFYCYKVHFSSITCWKVHTVRTIIISRGRSLKNKNERTEFVD